ATCQPAHVATQKKDAPAIGILSRVDHPQKSALSGPGGSRYKKKLASSYAGGEPLQYRDISAVGFVDVLENQDIAMRCAPIEALVTSESRSKSLGWKFVQLVWCLLLLAWAVKTTLKVIGGNLLHG